MTGWRGEETEHAAHFVCVGNPPQNGLPAHPNFIYLTADGNSIFRVMRVFGRHCPPPQTTLKKASLSALSGSSLASHKATQSAD